MEEESDWRIFPDKKNKALMKLAPASPGNNVGQSTSVSPGTSMPPPTPKISWNVICTSDGN